MHLRIKKIMIARRKISRRKKTERQKIAEKQGQQSKRLFSRKKEGIAEAMGLLTP